VKEDWCAMRLKPRLDAEQRRVVVIVLFVAGSLAAALVLAFLYSMPSAG
jgi:hypothetical protein